MTDRALKRLIAYWRTCPVDKPPFIPADDRRVLPSVDEMTFTSYDAYIRNETFGSNRQTAFHYGLLPIPYVGDLSSATVFILLLNPGLSHGDYFAEYSHPAFREAHVRNLRQELANASYPFHFLDPLFSWHPGFVYWQRKFDDILHYVASKRSISYQESLGLLSRQVAALELYGYHSKNYKGLPKGKVLASKSLMLGYVQEELIQRASCDEVSMIVTRGKSEWGLFRQDGTESIVLYDNLEARAAYLTRSSRGGAEIIRRIMKS